MTVTLLGAILERAVKRKLIDGNPAKDKDLRVKERKPARSYLDTATQTEALLDAAGELDREATKERRHIERRATLATLTFAGLRINELCGSTLRRCAAARRRQRNCGRLVNGGLWPMVANGTKSRSRHIRSGGPLDAKAR